MVSCHHVLLVWLLLAATSVRSSAGVVYVNNFEGAVGPEWSTGSTDATPTGRRFLGMFRNDTAQLNLSGLPAHDTVTVAFDLYVIGTWDGNAPMPEAGPDVWDLSVQGGPTLLHTTFGQWPGFTAQYGQAYPGPYPGGTHPFRTGATEVGTLGYTDPFWDGGGDTVYSLSLTLPHTSPLLQLNFSGNLSDSFPSNERWGIDNIVISTDSATVVPEPGTLTLLVIGTVGMLGFEWQRRRQLVQNIGAMA